MSHTLTTSMPITDLTFKAILKELISLMIDNRKALIQHPKMHQRPLVNPLQVVLAWLFMPIYAIYQLRKYLPLS